MSVHVPPEVERCASSLASRLRVPAGGSLVDVVVHGSAVLGDFIPGISDLDVLVILDADADADAPGPVLAALAAAIDAHDASPAIGLEASVVTARSALEPAEPWPYLVHVTTSAANRKIVTDGGDGDEDLILHYAVSRQSGWAVLGATIEEIIGPVPPNVVLAQLRRELLWAADAAPTSYAVLNACHALRYLETGRLVSKHDGGRWVLARGLQPDLVRRAIAEHRDGDRSWPDDEVHAWVTGVADVLLPSDAPG